MCGSHDVCLGALYFRILPGTQRFVSFMSHMNCRLATQTRRSNCVASFIAQLKPTLPTSGSLPSTARWWLVDGFAYSSPVIYRILLGLNDPVSTSQAVTSALATATATAVALPCKRTAALTPGRCTGSAAIDARRSASAPRAVHTAADLPIPSIEPPRIRGYCTTRCAAAVFPAVFGREHGRGVPRRRSGPGSASFLSEVLVNSTGFP